MKYFRMIKLLYRHLKDVSTLIKRFQEYSNHYTDTEKFNPYTKQQIFRQEQYIKTYP